MFGKAIRFNSEIRTAALALGVRLCWDMPIRSGDLYLAMRNTGVKLLTCFSVGDGFIIPEEKAYLYDFEECVKVEEV